MPVRKETDVVEEPDLRLVEEAPEVPHHRRRQHHRDQDHRGPEGVAAELAVDQVGEPEAEHGLDDDGPEHEVRRRLHRDPDVGVGQQPLVVAQPHPLDLGVRPVGAVVGEAEPDRPDQREDVDRQQQHDRRGDEQPGDRPVGQARAPAARRRRRGARRGVRGAVQRRSCSSVKSLTAHASRVRPPRGRGGREAAQSLPSSSKISVQSCDQLVERLLRRALVGDHVVVQPLLHRLQQLGVGRLLPEVLHLAHRLEELRRRTAGCRRSSGRSAPRCGGEAAERPPLLLHLGLGEPFDVGERPVHVVGVGDDADALAAERRGGDLLGRVDEVAGDRRRPPRPWPCPA